MKVEFTIAMNQEEKTAGNTHKVAINVEKCDDETMLKYAMKAYIVDIQSQIRANWDEFIKGEYPKELKVGQRMFESKKGAPVTTAQAADVLGKALEGMSMDEKLAYLKKIGLV